MLKIGQYNQLKVIKHVDFGVYLDGMDDGEILLPLKYMPEDCDVGQVIEVFVCFDSEDRLIATTEKPLIQVGQFAMLTVRAVEKVGAFLDWGLSKDLLLPFAEQIRNLRVGQNVVVFCYVDSSDRIAATMKVDKHAEKNTADLKVDQEVNLLIYNRTDLGYKALVDQKYIGVLFQNEVFQDIQYGQQLKGYIKQIRPDGKIDLRLLKAGHKAAQDLAPLILEELKKNQGFLSVTDKTSAEEIYDLFGVSKKKFKIALGDLYKKRQIVILDNGIQLTAK